MSRSKTFLTSAMLLLAGTGLMAGNYNTLLATAKKATNSGKTAIVVCNLEANSTTLDELSKAAGASGIELTGINIKNHGDVDKAVNSINGMRPRPSFVILVSDDKNLGADSADAPKFISRMMNIGIPSIGTGEKLLKVGARLAQGASEGQVLKAEAKN